LSASIFVFGDFELDAGRCELRRAGLPIEVQPRVLGFMLHLITQRERAVSAEELTRALWPDTSVGPGSLRRAVFGARRALGESGADSQSSIRTVRAFGYQFVQAVRVVAKPEVPTTEPRAESDDLPLAAAATTRRIA
jgi:DNA-binding winged helix-turn-helix (wHTH) protein